MRFPRYAHVVTCLPCGFRRAYSAGWSYPHVCANCGSGLEHYETTVDTLADWKDIYRPGARTGMKTTRPRLVVGSPA